MPQVEHEGRYAGRLTKMVIGQTSGGCLQLVADCLLGGEFDEDKGEYLKMEGPPQEITGYIILTKKNGDVNGYQYGVLKEALGWDGKDIADLQQKDFSEVKVAVWVIEDDYRNDGSFKVDFISAPLWTPGISKATPKEMDGFKKKWAATKSADDDAGELPPDEKSPFA